MKNNTLIGAMIVVWLMLMANIIWQETGGRWRIEDMEKIGQLEVAKYTDQIIVVAVSDEEARLCFYKYEKDRDVNSISDKRKGMWRLVLETEANIGENGLGKKKEGDGRTPTGVYRFTKAFGILENPGAKIDYTQVDEKHYWVDDSNSNYYNQFVDIDEINKDWNSAEHICEYKDAYKYVLATSYNSVNISGVGSAVFLHCISGEAESTAGCIAVPEVFMKELIKQVEPQCVLIIDEAENILEY